VELKPDYKQTEVGVIPEDWQCTTVRDIASPARNAIVGGPFGSDLVSNDYVQDGVPVIRGQNLACRYVSGPFVFVSSAKAKSLEANIARPGDLIFTQRGSLGQVCIVPRIPYDSYLISQSQMKVTPSRMLADPHFVYYVFSSSVHQDLIRQNTIQTGVPHINLGILRKIPIQLAPLAEQEAIAEALSDAYALVESLEQLLAKKRQLKQGAMQELLAGKKRLPGFSGGWEVRRLGDLADIRSGGTPSTAQRQFWDGDIPWCTPTDITGLDGFKYLSMTSRTISYLGLKSSSAEIIPANSVVMTSRATIGACAINRTPVTTNQGFKNFVPFQGVEVEFLYYLLLMQTQRFVSLCGGSTFLEIGKTQLVGFEVHVPSKTEQTAIAAILSDMDAETAALEAKLAKARALEQGMMQELLTGRIRLVGSAPDAAEVAATKQADTRRTKSHNWQINEAVIIAVLAKYFGSEQWPLGRKRYTKLSYLLHRHVERQVEGYLKKAAGPYNPSTKYRGPETIALKNGYVRRHTRDPITGFVAAEKIEEAARYFDDWYGEPALRWLEQFRYKTNDDLELLATVDMAMEDLRRAGRDVNLAAVKQVIQSHPEWDAKLNRPIFSDNNIDTAVETCRRLLPSEENER
jgi:type I restriction enzyme S subunit